MCCICEMGKIFDPRAHVLQAADAMGDGTLVHTRHRCRDFVDEIQS
jgi:hypothetical protein